ncbi:MAG: hypothetical protein JO283_22295 [Bradyrhizobium sp.]|nr:hypothetical protein [Bradyrhizobium sp.]
MGELLKCSQPQLAQHVSVEAKLSRREQLDRYSSVGLRLDALARLGYRRVERMIARNDIAELEPVFQLDDKVQQSPDPAAPRTYRATILAYMVFFSI